MMNTLVLDLVYLFIIPFLEKKSCSKVSNMIHQAFEECLFGNFSIISVVRANQKQL